MGRTPVLDAFLIEPPLAAIMCNFCVANMLAVFEILKFAFFKALRESETEVRPEISRLTASILLLAASATPTAARIGAADAATAAAITAASGSSH